MNGLTDFLHPCQIYADAFTAAERWAGPDGDLVASLKGRKIAFLGDTSFNMANSWILGASLFGMKISLAGPKGFEPGRADPRAAEGRGPAVRLPVHDRPQGGRRRAPTSSTPTSGPAWARRRTPPRGSARCGPTPSRPRVFAAAKPDALFMHCLPAHPGEEVEQAVLDNPRSVIFDEAENRLHVQKAILTLLSGKRA